MVALNDLKLRNVGAHVKQIMRNRLIEHKEYIIEHGACRQCVIGPGRSAEILILGYVGIMKRNKNNHSIIKLLTIGLLIAGLGYCLHPGFCQFSLTINGEPVAEPLARLAAVPTLLIVLVFTGLFAILAFWGVGMMLILGTLLFVVLGIFTIVPYLWPALAIIFVVLLMSLSREKQD